MKILLVGFKGEFNNTAGVGIRRYSYQLYHNLLKFKKYHKYDIKR